MKKITAILAVYNAVNHTKTCLQYLRQDLEGLPHEIIVINNGSTDGTAAYLENEPDLKVITHAEPQGVAFSYNEAIEASTGDYLLFLHNDVVVPPDTTAYLLSKLEQDPQAGAIGPLSNAVHWHRQMCWNVPSYEGTQELFQLANQIRQQDVTPFANLYVENFFLLMRRQALQAVGGFDASFPLHYLEDIDLCLRLWQHGWRVLIAPSAYVHHERGATFACNGINAQEAFQTLLHFFEEKRGFNPGYSGCLRMELIQYLNLQRSNLAILDVGCALGANLLYLREHCPDAHLFGIEMNPHTAEFAQGFGRVITGNAEAVQNSLWQNKFDYILCGDVIEHLREPWAAVKKFASWLKPGGEILASVPNVQHISILRDLLTGVWPYAEAGILDRTHLRFFTLPSIRTLFTDAGLSFEKLGGSQGWEGPRDGQLEEELKALKSVEIEPEGFNIIQYFIRARKEA